MVQLHENQGKLEAAGIQVVGISFDSVDVLRAFSEAQKISFPLLSDQDSKTIKEFDLLFNERGLPHPATVLIDQEGVIRDKLFREGYVDRHSIEDLLAAAKALSE